ncbi:MAG: 1-acyl-sn-glycerol-3-phosphate acyltransferase [Candidatus Limnocylindrales bacterium]|nr:1-acyl-sn-glycerol-3-phosphate acyltransferase [Candidatus Limnocylindrales bacterium]
MTASSGTTPRDAAISPWRLTLRYWISRLVVAILTRAYLRVRIYDRGRLPAGPAIYCFNHLGWVDPFVLMAVLPFRPKLYFFGPKEEDMHDGARNRIMGWTGTPIPYKPGKNDLLGATRRVSAVVAAGGVVAIAGEGRIHASESELWPLNDGAAYFALHNKVPIVPLAINGSSWLRFGGRVTVRVGEPLPARDRPNREAVAALTQQTWEALHALVRDAPDVPVPGRFGRWFTERFNEWPEGSREATLAASASRQADSG